MWHKKETGLSFHSDASKRLSCLSQKLPGRSDTNITKYGYIEEY